MAVIIILAVIALISVPIVLNIIENARKSAFKDTAYGLIESAKLAYTENLIDGKTEATTYAYPFNNLKFNGSKPSGGIIYIDENGDTEIAVHNNKWCALKTKENSKVEIIRYEEATCKVEDVEIPAQKTFTEMMESKSSEVMSNDPDHNLRYVGANPNNYVKFNNELWRVIGVFEGQTKIIRDEYYNSTDISWDSNSNHDWNVSTLQVELNTTFLGSIDSASKELIDQNYVWKLSEWSKTNENPARITRDVMYQNERKMTAVNVPTTWTGAIGLMYPSDYGYATSSEESYCDTVDLHGWSDSSYADCKNQNWLYDSSKTQWTIVPCSVDMNFVFVVDSDAHVGWHHAWDTKAAKPVLYLKSEVKIQSGKGTKDQPFNLVM